MKFTRKIKSNWISAMKSGEYKHGEGVFYDSREDCYCALGVLCMITEELRSPRPDGHEDYTGVSKMLPKNTYEKVYEINDSSGSFEHVIEFVENIETALEPYEELVEFRHEQGLSIREVAKEAGLSKSTLHRLENGVTVGRVHWEKLNQYYKSISKNS